MTPIDTTSHAHEVYVVKFGEYAAPGTAADYFLTPPPGIEAKPSDLDFVVWVVRTPSGDILVDAGFTSQTAASRNRPHFREPSEAVRMLGVDPAQVPFVVLTHFHYDHVGDLDPFSSARMVVQSKEMAFWTGPHASRPYFRRLIEKGDIARLVGLAIDGRVLFVDGSREIVPGVSVHHVGGHTPGMQVVSVETARGTVVLASDACHFRAHIEHESPANLVTDLPGMYDAFDVITSLASSPALVVPGHDPDVLNHNPAVAGLEGIAARIA